MEGQAVAKLPRQLAGLAQRLEGRKGFVHAFEGALASYKAPTQGYSVPARRHLQQYLPGSVRGQCPPPQSAAPASGAHRLDRGPILQILHPVEPAGDVEGRAPAGSGPWAERVRAAVSPSL